MEFTGAGKKKKESFSKKGFFAGSVIDMPEAPDFNKKNDGR